MINLVKSHTIVEKTIEGKPSVIELETENHGFGFTPTFGKFSPNLFQIIDTGTIDRTKVPAAQDFLDKILKEGITDNGRTFVPVCAGSSNQRNGQFVLCDKEHRSEFLKWASCGLDLRKLSVGKATKYISLMLSSVRPWEQVFTDDGLYGLMQYPHPSTWGVFNDVDVPAIGIFDVVTPWAVERKLILEQDGETNKITDGVMMYVIDDTACSAHQRKNLIKLSEAFSVRAPMTKGLMVPILKSALMQFYADHPEVSSIVKDAWGNEVDILGLKVITFKSVFKAWKCVGNWQEYVDAFNKYEHRVWICVQAHGKRWAPLPYQQMQTLDASNEEILQLARLSVDFLLNNAVPGKAGKIIGGVLGKAVDAYPNLLSDPFVKEQLARKWVSRQKQMFGGRILHISHNLFCSPDIVAVLEGLHNMPVKGVLPADAVHTAAFGYGKKLGCTRCPHFDHAWVTPNNIDVSDEHRGFFCGSTIFYSAHDNTMKIHQMDFDGDHSNVTDNPLLIRLAEHSKEVWGNVCLLYSSMDNGSKSTCEDYDAEFNVLCRNSNKAPIGLYANTLTKAYGFRTALRRKDKIGINLWTKMKCATRKGNTCIDEAGGHGKDASIGLAETMLDEFKRVAKPLFLSYAKGSISQDNRIIPVSNSKNTFEFKPDGVVDLYSAVCRTLTPDKVEEVLDFSSVGKCDIRYLMSCPTIRDRDLSNRLAGISKLFGDLADSASSEEMLIAECSSLAAMPDFKMDKAMLISLKIAEFALDRGCALDDAVDFLVYCYFHKMTKNTIANSIAKRWLFIVFGDRILNNIASSKNVEFFDDGEYDEEEDEA